MGQIEKVLEGVEEVKYRRVHYRFCDNEKIDVEAVTREALKRPGTLDRIECGKSVAITAGSREIKNLAKIIGTLVSELKKVGAEPFIIPAMGSHGGATPEGQGEILENFGITEETMGVPVRCAMETQEVGKAPNGLSVHAAKTALAADYIIPVGRIKPHTDFRGDHESGLMKMLAIGLGKQHGADICHKQGMKRMSTNVRDFGQVCIENCNIPFGLGIIENGHHDTYKIVAVPAELIIKEEPALLLEAKALVPLIPFKKVDVIISEQIGKEISGAGADPNVIGRSASLGISAPYAERIGIFDLTDASHGNVTGIGLGDATTQRLFNKISFEMTYPNTITASEPHGAKIPAVMPNDKLCVDFCIRTCVEPGENGTRVVWIKNTLSMDEFYISESLVQEAEKNERITVDSETLEPMYSENGDFIKFVPVK